jgi:NTE family protein
MKGTRPINLALQGGGSHGAFTWGVLDCLLEDGRFAIEGVSGTSAGAMNAVCLADGMVANGPEGAREKLHDFWRAVGRNWRWNPVQRTPWDAFMGN